LIDVPSDEQIELIDLLFDLIEQTAMEALH